MTLPRILGRDPPVFLKSDGCRTGWKKVVGVATPKVVGVEPLPQKVVGVEPTAEKVVGLDPDS